MRPCSITIGRDLKFLTKIGPGWAGPSSYWVGHKMSARSETVGVRVNLEHVSVRDCNTTNSIKALN